MKPLQYIISNNGLGIAVGIVGDKQTALEDAILAENLYGVNHSDHLFSHLIYMSSIESFKKFLTIKEYFLIWDEHWTRNRVAKTMNPANVLRFTRRAIKRARIIMDGSVTYQNFMGQIGSRNNEYSIGGYSDEAAEE
jgi:hypothetical protein